jgi:hypothetical protein
MRYSFFEYFHQDKRCLQLLTSLMQVRAELLLGSMGRGGGMMQDEGEADDDEEDGGFGSAAASAAVFPPKNCLILLVDPSFSRILNCFFVWLHFVLNH